MKPIKANHRPNVAAVIVNEKKQILAGKRRGVDTHGWQLPQGGVDEGESLKEAILREIKEETGLQSIVILNQTSQWLYYTFPSPLKRKGKEFLGQGQIYFSCRIEGDEQPIASDELEAFAWMEPKDFLKEVVPFKRAAYAEGIGELFS